MKASEVKKNWVLIDAKDMVLGRLAAEVAKLLMGKHKPSYTAHMDCGDNVIVVNARHVYLSGGKSDINRGKIYYWHTGYPGGIKSTTAGKLLAGKTCDRVIRRAVAGMLSKNVIGKIRLSNLRIYADEQHKQVAQQPTLCDLAKINVKNAKR